ncbi:MAG: hypothetical protein H0U69_03625 [Trueperaceae bacterium]|nr:hypothetical protein [Trueperaceae bacterium]
MAIARIDMHRTFVFEVADIRAASRHYAELRDFGDYTPSQMGDGIISDSEGETIAVVTYNARVWAYDADDVERRTALLFDPAAPLTPKPGEGGF